MKNRTKELDRIKFYMKQNLSKTEIAKLIGLSSQRVGAIIRTYKLKYPDIKRYKVTEKNKEETLVEEKQKILKVAKIPKSHLVPIDKIKIWTKRKRQSLGLPENVGKYSGGLELVRNMVRIRDSHTCQSCYKIWTEGTRKFDVHHLDIKQEGIRDIKYDRENIDKMITLCHKCHYGLHTVRNKMKKDNRAKNKG